MVINSNHERRVINMLSYLEAPYPYPLRIKEEGWQKFLEKTDANLLHVIYKPFFNFGFRKFLDGDFSEPTRKQLANAGIQVPEEIFEGGFDYPPKTPEQQQLAQAHLQKLRDVLEQLDKVNQAKNCPLCDAFFFEDVLLQRGTQIYPPVNENTLSQQEKILGVELPNSYKNFLQVTNGLLMPGVSIAPINQLQWVRDRCKMEDDEYIFVDWIDVQNPADDLSEAEYFAYDDKQSSVHYNSEHLRECLLISSPNNEWYSYLLNPKVQIEPGEWEAWWLDPKLPGAARYPTFRDLLENKYITQIGVMLMGYSGYDFFQRF